MLADMPNAMTNERIDHALRRAAEQHFDLSVREMAALAGYSQGHFQRQFRSRFGISPGQLLRHQRIKRFGALLRKGYLVTEAAVEAGFESSSRWHQAACDGLGMTPSRARNGGCDARIEYGIADCRLGRVLVAATVHGICAVLLGDADDVLENELTARFPRALLEPGGDQFVLVQRRVVALVDHGDTNAGLPLDLRGTVFQHRVWTALQRIPAGSVVTYGDLAGQLGLPGGARAVAQACGANPLAVVVPCHRVVAADGGPGGYRWGIERKRTLLRLEGR